MSRLDRCADGGSGRNHQLRFTGVCAHGWKNIMDGRYLQQTSPQQGTQSHSFSQAHVQLVEDGDGEDGQNDINHSVEAYTAVSGSALIWEDSPSSLLASVGDCSTHEDKYRPLTSIKHRVATLHPRIPAFGRRLQTWCPQRSRRITLNES